MCLKDLRFNEKLAALNSMHVGTQMEKSKSFGTQGLHVQTTPYNKRGHQHLFPRICYL